VLSLARAKELGFCCCYEVYSILSVLVFCVLLMFSVFPADFANAQITYAKINVLVAACDFLELYGIL